MLKASDLELKPYSSPFAGQADLNGILIIIHLYLEVSNPFTSTLLFFEDLIFTAEHVIKVPYPLTALKKLLNLINKAISPSYIYIPFVKGTCSFPLYYIFSRFYKAIYSLKYCRGRNKGL